MTPQTPASETQQSSGNIHDLYAVIKVGGSLGRHEGLPDLCQTLSSLGREYRVLVIPGGGQGADCVRYYYRRWGLTDSAAHWMAILAMDQYGLLLQDMTENSQAVTSLAQAARIMDFGELPILLPYGLLKESDPLPHSWQVTSDSIAAWAAREAGAAELVLLKDVDGLYEWDSDGTPGRGELLTEIDLDLLARSQGVDSFLARLMKQGFCGLWVINGAKPERLAQLLADGSTLGTRLTPPSP